MKRAFVTLWLLLLVVSSSCAASGALRGAIPASDAVAFDQRLGNVLPLASRFTDERGNTLPLASFFGGRPVILLLGYNACPNLCSSVRMSLVHTLGRTRLTPGLDYEVLAVSIDPTESSGVAGSPRDRSFEMAGVGGANGWRFLTGGEAAIGQLTQAVGFHYAYDPALRQFAHPAGVVIVTPRGRVSRYFLGVDYPPKELASSLGAAERSQIGIVVPSLLLRCFHYDPATGRYSLGVTVGARVLGLLCLGALALLIVTLTRRSRQAAQTTGGAR